jgi:hypothetical protein
MSLLRLGLAAALLGFAVSARAEMTTGATFVESQTSDWEFGLDWGMMIPTQKKSFSHVIDNQRVLDLLADETVLDETLEGFKAPPFPGNSTIGATYTNMPEIGIHLYRRFTDWLAWGLDGGYGLRKQLAVDARGIYVANNFLQLNYTGNVIHFTAPVKVGPRLGRIKPYLLGGPGVYIMQETATISFNDNDDPQLRPLAVVSRSAIHPGLAGGAGIDVLVGDRGLIGLEMQYHRVFARNDNVSFLLPKMRFSVTF